MRELNADRRVLTLHEGDEGLEALHLGIIPDAKVVLIDQANLFDGGCLDKDKPEAAEGIAAEMHVVKGTAGATGAGAVVHHGGHDQTVLEGKAADAERPKQQRSHSVKFFGDRG